MDNGFKYSYKQIFCDLESGILSGKLLPGYRIPSVRALAVQYQVNPNTVQHAVKKLERAGLLISLKGSGIMVTENTEIIYRLKQERIGEIVCSFVTQMKLLGYSWEEMEDFLC